MRETEKDAKGRWRGRKGSDRFVASYRGAAEQAATLFHLQFIILTFPVIPVLLLVIIMFERVLCFTIVVTIKQQATTTKHNFILVLPPQKGFQFNNGKIIFANTPTIHRGDIKFIYLWALTSNDLFNLMVIVLILNGSVISFARGRGAEITVNANDHQNDDHSVVLGEHTEPFIRLLAIYCKWKSPNSGFQKFHSIIRTAILLSWRRAAVHCHSQSRSWKRIFLTIIYTYTTTPSVENDSKLQPLHA